MEFNLECINRLSRQHLRDLRNLRAKKIQSKSLPIGCKNKPADLADYADNAILLLRN